MRILFCSSYTIRLFSKICWTKYVFPLCVGPTTKSENLWRKLNSGQDLVAKDVVCVAVLGLFAGGECSHWLTRFSLGFSAFADGGEHATCHDDTWACFRWGFLSSGDNPWTLKRCVLRFFKWGRPQTGQVRGNRLGMVDRANDRCLSINCSIYSRFSRL